MDTSLPAPWKQCHSPDRLQTMSQPDLNHETVSDRLQWKTTWTHLYLHHENSVTAQIAKVNQTLAHTCEQSSPFSNTWAVQQTILWGHLRDSWHKNRCWFTNHIHKIEDPRTPHEWVLERCHAALWKKGHQVNLGWRLPSHSDVTVHVSHAIDETIQVLL
jgi:hypothetical protein